MRFPKCPILYLVIGTFTILGLRFPRVWQLTEMYGIVTGIVAAKTGVHFFGVRIVATKTGYWAKVA